MDGEAKRFHNLDLLRVQRVDVDAAKFADADDLVMQPPCLLIEKKRLKPSLRQPLCERWFENTNIDIGNPI